jgi:hypothetical protein
MSAKPMAAIAAARTMTVAAMPNGVESPVATFPSA